MKKYKVNMETVVYATVIVEAENENDARDLAYEEFGGLTGFCGNGGSDKLVGVYGGNVSLDVSDHVELSGDNGDVEEIE